MIQEPTVKFSDLIIAIEDTGAQWLPGFTSVSNLSPDQKKLRLGLEVTPDVLQQIEQETKVPNDVTIMAGHAIGYPLTFDLRNVNGKNFISPIKDQGACATGVVFAVLDVVEGTFRVQRQDPNLQADLSEAHLFYCYAKNEGQTCSGPGWLPEEAYDHIKAIGVVDEACFPYTPRDQDCKLCGDWQNRLIKITGYQTLTGDAAAMKSWISTKGPLSAAMIVYPDFLSYKSGIYRHVYGNYSGGVLVSIIGYDDNQKYWICKNHWSSQWGENGFFRIAYGECGIDSWLVHGVQGIEETMWLHNLHITGLWAIDQNRTAAAYFAELRDWRQIAADNDSIFICMLSQIIAAKAANRNVTIYEEKGYVKRIYVL
jgi:C1A family cysteine protease